MASRGFGDKPHWSDNYKEYPVKHSLALEKLRQSSLQMENCDLVKYIALVFIPVFLLTYFVAAIPALAH